MKKMKQINSMGALILSLHKFNKIKINIYN